MLGISPFGLLPARIRHAGVGVVSLGGAPVALPTFATLCFGSFVEVWTRQRRGWGPCFWELGSSTAEIFVRSECAQ